ncbi:hypothetical protein ACLOJK_008507 [Asimina triloba]
MVGAEGAADSALCNRGSEALLKGAGVRFPMFDELIRETKEEEEAEDAQALQKVAAVSRKI